MLGATKKYKLGIDDFPNTCFAKSVMTSINGMFDLSNASLIIEASKSGAADMYSPNIGWSKYELEMIRIFSTPAF